MACAWSCQPLSFAASYFVPHVFIGFHLCVGVARPRATVLSVPGIDLVMSVHPVASEGNPSLGQCRYQNCIHKAEYHEMVVLRPCLPDAGAPLILLCHYHPHWDGPVYIIIWNNSSAAQEALRERATKLEVPKHLKTSNDLLAAGHIELLPGESACRSRYAVACFR